MDDVLQEFLTEGSEGLAQLDLDLVELERHPESQELINRIFRAIHTIKGTCGFLDLTRLEAVAHATESVLMQVRERRLAVSQAVMNDVLAGVDAIKHIMSHLESTQKEPTGDDAAVIERLGRWLAGEAEAEAPLEAGTRGTFEMFETGEVIPIHDSAVPAPAAAKRAEPAPAAPVTAAPAAAPQAGLARHRCRIPGLRHCRDSIER